MRPFRWRSSKSTTPAQPADPLAVPPVDPLATAGNGSRIDWRRAVPRLLAVLVIAAAIVLGGLWAAGAFKNDYKPAAGKVKPAPQTAQKAAPDHGKSSPATSPGAPATPTTPSAPTTPVPAQPPGASGQSQASTPGQTATSNLTNTGPGETLAVFAVATAAGTALYQINLRRRLGAG